MALRHVFLAGIPSTGKSYIGNWLQHERGYFHVDAELDGELGRLGLRIPWDTAMSSLDFSGIAIDSAVGGKPLVLSWGFPSSYMFAASAIVRAGFQPWWFDGDIAAARREHIRCGKSPSKFDIQVSEIKARESQLHSIFQPNIIHVLQSDGTRTPPREVGARILSAA